MSLFGAVEVGEQCKKEALKDCVPLNGTECFGATLDYSYTSVELVTDANTLKQAEEKLLLWSGLTSVPQCWKVIQPLLCSLYLPKCENGTIHLPDRSLCQDTRSPCQIVEIENGWPGFMVCDNDAVFADNCPKPFKTEQFNASECERPLMPTSNPSSWYEGVEGCGLQCMNPLFDQAEHDDMHIYIAVWASITAVCTLFAMLSFFIDWKNSSKYPARIIFYINVCFFLCSFGWLAQFFQDARNEIICRKDGTVRLGEPVGHEESPSCVIIFVLVYFFVMAGVAWFVVLSYSWKTMFKALGKADEPLKGKTLRFHLFVWSIAFVLLIASLAVSQVDGDSMSGICFIGYKNHWYRMGFLLVPIGLMLAMGGFFLFRGLHSLLSLKQGHDGLLSESAVSKITWTMIRIGLFAFFAFAFVFVTFACHVYEIVNQPLWDRSFRDYIRCDANITILEKLREEVNDPASPEAGGCVIGNRPNIAVMKIHLFAMFGTGIVMSTWVWTRASFMNWRRAWFKLIGRSDNEMKRIKHRSRMIAKAFANRHALGLGRKKKGSGENEGTDNAGFNPADLEFSEHTLTHQDPVGMDFDLNSISQELSSNWVRNVPQMVRRRGAIMPQPVSSNSPTPTPVPTDDQNKNSSTWATGTSKNKSRQSSSRVNVRDLKRVAVDNNNEEEDVGFTKKKLPPLRTRGSALVPLDERINPTRISTRETQMFQPNMLLDQMLPGLVGPGSSQGETYAEVAFRDDVISPPQIPFMVDPTPEIPVSMMGSGESHPSKRSSASFSRHGPVTRSSKNNSIMRAAW